MAALSARLATLASRQSRKARRPLDSWPVPTLINKALHASQVTLAFSLEDDRATGGPQSNPACRAAESVKPGVGRSGTPGTSINKPAEPAARATELRLQNVVVISGNALTLVLNGAKYAP